MACHFSKQCNKPSIFAVAIMMAQMEPWIIQESQFHKRLSFVTLLYVSLSLISIFIFLSLSLSLSLALFISISVWFSIPLSKAILAFFLYSNLLSMYHFVSGRFFTAKKHYPSFVRWIRGIFKIINGVWQLNICVWLLVSSIAVLYYQKWTV